MTKALLPVVILAGGLATRLQPLTQKLPKALIPINHQPFILHQLKLLAANNIKQIFICIGYLGNLIKETIESSPKFGLEIQFFDDGPNLLGTGGAIKQAAANLPEHFFVLYGDSYLNCSYYAVQQAFFEQKKLSLMTVFRNQGMWDQSNIEYIDGVILTYSKKITTPKMNYIDYGLGVFSKKAFNFILADTKHDLADLYQLLLDNNQLAAFEITERFYEIGSFAGIKELEYYLHNKHKDLYGIY